MPRLSAGVLLYRETPAGDEVFIAHMGGPFWRGRERAWTIPKGELEPGENPLLAALREFAEEIGVAAPHVDYVELGMFRQSSAKSVVVFAARAELRVDEVHSNTVKIELPRGSGRMVEIPEIDDARWIDVAKARTLVIAGQVAALDAAQAAFS
ncbi:NUDIX domain-containing protein [Gryllotalpicola reticulitermitis]|uniref:NUDIX domain-containing protein n=1 Tax=Gryllotalpicola reticulitermitis TaxID=1184153 RepID=A0ABV8Q6M7_9MICO